MDPKIAFCKHWWRVCYRRYQVTNVKRARKTLRKAMREAATTVLSILKGACDE
jgi:hypothetical protein